MSLSIRTTAGCSWNSILIGTISILMFFLSWECLGGVEGWKLRSVLPPPSVFLQEVLDSGLRLGLGSQATPISQSVWATFYRVFVGLGIAFILALLTGSLFSTSRVVTWIVLPILHLFAPIAPIAWIPLGIVLFGIGDSTAIFVVFMGVYFIHTLGTLAEIERVPAAQIETARNFGLSPMRTWITVILPMILPGVYTLLRINFIAAWMGVLAAEMIGLRDGIGAIIMLGRNLFSSEITMFGMSLIAISGFVTDRILDLLGRRFLWWKIS